MSSPKQVTYLVSNLLMDKEVAEKLSPREITIAIQTMEHIFTKPVAERRPALQRLRKQIEDRVAEKKCRTCKKPINPPNTENTCSC